MSPRALQGMIEKFDTRVAGDYQERETELVQKVAQVREQLLHGAASIFFYPGESHIISFEGPADMMTLIINLSGFVPLGFRVIQQLPRNFGPAYRFGAGW